MLICTYQGTPDHLDQFELHIAHASASIWVSNVEIVQYKIPNSARSTLWFWEESSKQKRTNGWWRHLSENEPGCLSKSVWILLLKWLFWGHFSLSFFRFYSRVCGSSRMNKRGLFNPERKNYFLDKLIHIF